MNTTSGHERLEKTLEILLRSIQESWGYYSTAKGISIGLNPIKYPPPAVSFLGLTWEACIRSSISTLAELISNNKDAINLNYLLNIANDSPASFKFAKRVDIKKAIVKDRDWLEKLTSYGAIGNRIIDKRDKMIAHLDRKFATEPKPGFISANPPLTIDEVEGVYEQLMEKINASHGYYYGQPVKVYGLDDTPIRDLEYMFRLIEIDAL